MSFNRIKQDKCTYDQKIKRSVSYGDYRLFPESNVHCNPCLSFSGGVRNSREDVSTVRDRTDIAFGEMAEVESHLQNRVNPLTECNKSASDNKHREKKVYHKEQCSMKILTDDTRFTHPLDNYRGLSLTEFHLTPYLHVSKQENIQHDEHRTGFDSRNYVRRNFEKKSWDSKSVRHQSGDKSGDYAYPRNIELFKGEEEVC